MRTLVFTIRRPFPPVGGAPMRVWQTINVVRRWGPVMVVSTSSDFDEDCPNLPVDAETRVFPEPSIRRRFDQRALRRLQRERFRLAHGKNVPFFCSAFDERKVEKVVSEFAPDLIVFHEPWLFPYLPIAQRSGAAIIHASHNVEAVLRADITASEAAAPSTPSTDPSVEAVERQVVEAADQVWVCSETDANTMRQLYGASLDLHVIPNGLDGSAYSVRDYTPPERGRASAVFPGIFNYPPNVEAADIIMDHVLPRLRQVSPDARIVLLGKYPTDRMLARAKSDDGLVVTGFVESTRPYFEQCHCVLVPLMVGSGTRWKIVEAFAYGRPVVSTAKGAEGIDYRDGEHLLIGETPDELVAHMQTIWADPGLSRRLIDNARRLFVANYSWDAVAERVGVALSRLGRLAA